MMAHIDPVHQTDSGLLTPRILQFGSGVFLRGFIDWMVNRMNQSHAFGGSVIMVKLTPGGSLAAWDAQGGVFQHITRGIQDGETVNQTELITCVQQWLHPYEDWQAFLATAQQSEILCVTSNSTEAGIQYHACPLPDDCCPESFPAKLCAWLHTRFQSGLPGVWVMPCELIEDNGDQLYEIVHRHARDWKLSDGFISWLGRNNTFINTLVDRIVSPPPADERSHEQQGDRLLNASEPYHLLVLDCDETFEGDLPLRSSGFNVVYASDLTPYRERKVKLLNGAHTSMLFLSYLRGNNTVEESMADEAIAGFLRHVLYEEVMPTIAMDADELAAYAESVLERFRNPFLKHQLLSISLNSISKIQHRVLGTLQDYVRLRGTLPQGLCLSLASMLYFYRGSWQGDVYQGQRGGEPYAIKDDLQQLQRISDWWQGVAEPGALAGALPALLRDSALWGSDLTQVPGLVEAVTAHVQRLWQDGVDAALAAI